ncbi:MAG TPA: glycosyltransferase, partial [Candidatus Didemnitutus sp.]|nr:glycosyltransferase [Candidatus Didemnitutus sp.]
SAAQLYRLLVKYPVDRLQVIEVDCPPSKPDRRLAGVRYHHIATKFDRGWHFGRTRFPALFRLMLKVNARLQARHAAKLVASFRPEAILTIHDQFGWVTGAKLAEQLQVPLHLILHDDWFRNIPMVSSLQPRLEESFGRVYRAAASRLCISPYMERQYAGRFQAPGTVLYPIRGEQAVHQSPPAAAEGSNARPLTIAYAGNIWHRGNWKSLRHLTEALKSLGGRLFIFGPTTPADVVRNELAQSQVTVRGFAPDLIRALRDEADVVFVQMTFDPSEKRNMEICFPSKLAEYSAAGLPVLIHGPEYSSAVQWAREHPDAAEVVTQEGSDALRVAVERLQDPKRREILARRILELGNHYFSFDEGTKIFQTAVQSGHRPEAAH